jgi:hypothetical protein
MVVDTFPNVERPKGNRARWAEKKLGLREGSLLNSTEVARHLGVTRQRVSQLKRHDPTFPRAGIGGFGADLWRRAGIEAWAAMHRPTRPVAGGRFTGEAARLLLAADRGAVDADHHFVEAGHVWAAACSGAAGEPLALTLASVGIVPAEVATYLKTMRGTGTRTFRKRSMTPHLQNFLVAADHRAASDGRSSVTAIDVLLAFVEAPPRPDDAGRKRPDENFLDLLDRRGLDISELRRRLLAVEADPASASAFEPRTLRRLRRGRSGSLMAGVELMRNGLGHDPKTRFPWGAAFGRTRDGRSLVIDGEQWFFSIDGDGYFIRASDGRPVGYRWRIRPKPRKRPVNGFNEVLPMPPVELDDWPDRRFGGDD